MSDERHGHSDPPTGENLFGLYNFSIDLELNEKDNQFVTDSESTDREIIYFVDANVGLAFVSPGTQALKSTLTSLPWKERDQGTSAVAALLATEYIFSHSLLGKKTKGVFVTRWHREELARKFASIHFDCISNLVSLGKAGAQERLKIKLNLLSKSKLSPSEFLEVGRTLATDDTVEPLEQMDRLMAGELIGRTPARLGLTQDQRDKSEKFRQSFRKILEHSKSGPTLDRDVRSLSYLQYLADEVCPTDKRLVLVTADFHLIEGYRIWFHSRKRDQELAPKQFIVRSAAQYLPQINIGNSRDSNSANLLQSKKLFSEIRELVELTILPEMMRSLEKDRYFLTREDFDRHRSKVDSKQVEATLSRLSDIQNQSIYFFDEYLRKRLPAELADRELSDNEIALRLRRRLSQSIANSTRDLIPFAAAGFVNVSLKGWERIPATLLFPIKGRYLFSVIRQAIRKGHIDLVMLDSNLVYEMFAIGAGVALAVSQQSGTSSNNRAGRHALRNAELCLHSCSWAEDGYRKKLLREANFLCAVVNRFQLGSCASSERAQEHFLAALRHLQAIELTDDLSPDAVRTKAEKGALFAFMATRRLAEKTDGVFECIDHAYSALKECYDNAGAYTGEGPHAAVQRHYCHNLASILSLRVIALDEHENGLVDHGELVRSIETALRIETHAPAFLKAELYFFLALVNREIRPKIYPIVRSLLETARRPSLLVDQWQGDLMLQYMERDSSF